MGNEVSTETIAAAGAASAAAAVSSSSAPPAAGRKKQRTEQQNTNEEQGLGDRSSCPLGSPSQDGKDNNNIERSGAIDLLGLKERPARFNKDDENGPKNFQDAATSTTATAPTPDEPEAPGEKHGYNLRNKNNGINGNKNNQDFASIAAAAAATTAAAATAAAAAEEQIQGAPETKEGQALLEEWKKLLASDDSDDDDGDEDKDEDKDEDGEDDDDDGDTTDTEKAQAYMVNEEEEDNKEEEKKDQRTPVQVYTVNEDDESEEDDMEEEEEEQGGPRRVSSRIKARQAAAAQARKRASLLRERAPTSKKAMIKKATKAGLDIRKAFKAAGKLGKLDRVLERKGSQSADTLRNRKARSLPTRKRSEEAKSKVQETRKAHQEKRKAQEEPKAPEEETAEETPTKNKRSKRRKVDTRPTSVNCVKDRTVRAKFAVTAKHLSELQYCSTWENKIDRNEKPKSQHFMYTYDEMVQKPHCSENSRTRRPGGPSSIFLCPEDYELKELGQRLIAVGKEMMRKNGEGYHCTTDPNEYHDLVFGEKIKLNR